MNGTKDIGHTRTFKNIYKLFKASGYNARVNEIPGLGHEFPLVRFEVMIDWWRELDGERIKHYSKEVAFRKKKKDAVMMMRAKKYREAARLFNAILREAPRDAAVHYDLACLYSMTNKLNLSLQYLVKAIECGFGSPKHIRQDKDLANLRKQKAFEELIRKYQKKKLLPEG